MKKALCKKDYYRYSSALNGMPFNLKIGKYYEYDVVYKDFTYLNIKYVNFEYRDISGEGNFKDRLSVEEFDKYFYSEKEIRKIKLKNIYETRRKTKN